VSAQGQDGDLREKRGRGGWGSEGLGGCGKEDGGATGDREGVRRGGSVGSSARWRPLGTTAWPHQWDGVKKKNWLRKNRGTDYTYNHRTLSSNSERPGRHQVECNQLAVFADALQRVCVREAHVMGKGRPRQCTCERTRAIRPRRPVIFRHAVGRFDNIPSLAFTAPFSRGTLRGVVPTRDFRQKIRDIAGIFLVGLKSIPLS